MASAVFSFSRVFVTGGSGFLGGNLIRHLVDKCGCEVVAIARSDKAASAVQARGATKVVKGVDLGDVQALAKAAEGCDCAVHCAADVTQWAKDFGPIREANVQGTLNVIDACKQVGIKKVICVGTENGLLCGQPLRMVDESHPFPPDGANFGPYSTTKKEAEIAALARNSDEVQVVVVRPRFIWGGDDSTLLPAFAKAVKSGDLKWFSGGTYLTSTVHIDNCVHGIVCALKAGKGGEAYFLTDGEPMQFKQFLTDMLEAAGVKGVDRIGSVPLNLAWAGAIVLEAIARLTNKPPVVTRGVLATLGMEVTVSDAKARRDLGYSNVVSIEDGLAELRTRYADKSVFEVMGA